MEQFRLEKTSQITKITQITLIQHFQAYHKTMFMSVTSTYLFNTLRDADLATSLSMQLQGLTILFVKEIFPNVQSKPSLVQLQATSSHPVSCYLGEDIDPHLATASFQKIFRE